MHRFTTFLILLSISFTHLQSMGEEPPKLNYEEVEIANRDIHESSGIAPSWRFKNMFWTHNDSGADAVIYAVGADGKDHGSVKLEGATAKDWEDICSFYKNNTPYLLIADVGDNAEKRKHLTLMILKEPKPSEKSAKVEQVIQFTYEDGKHNCESVAMDPVTNTVYFVTKKQAKTCGVYAMEIHPTAKNQTLKARRIGNIPALLATGMDISPDGKRAVIVTYLLALEYPREETETWAQAFAKEPRIIQVPPRTQGEAICYGLDSRTLYLTSEQLPAPLFKVIPKRE
jgi:hypothetical protein